MWSAIMIVAVLTLNLGALAAHWRAWRGILGSARPTAHKRFSVSYTL